MNNRRNGKIARLPNDVREVVNQMIRDGAEYSEIVEELRVLGHEDIRPRNVSRWYQGGYQDWLKEQNQLEELKREKEFAARFLKENAGSSMHEAALQLMTLQMFRLLQRFDMEGLEEGLEATPQNYSGLLRAFTQVSRRATEYERLKLSTATQNKKWSEGKSFAPGERGVSRETLERAAKELKLFKSRRG